uniref:J domain-containing protein n=1 Tax=Noctiluca scintillans TaxID=2966 RepID=A0A7S1AKB3_NOCSC
MSGGMMPLSALGGSSATRPNMGQGIPGMFPGSMPSSMPTVGVQNAADMSMDMTNGGLPLGSPSVPSTGLLTGLAAAGPEVSTDGTLATSVVPAGTDPGDTLAEYGKVGSGKDVLMPIAIPTEMGIARPVPKQVACLEDGTDIFKMFNVDPQAFDIKAVRRGYHRLAAMVHPDKLGRDATSVDQARFMRLKQAYTVMMDDQLRAVYRQYCFGIAGSGGCEPMGHDAALSKALVMGRELRKMGEERAIVLHRASETGWAVQQKDQDGRLMRGDGRKLPHQFNLFGDISSSEDDEAELEKERRGMTIEQMLEKSPKYADVFLERSRPLLLDPRVSSPKVGDAFTLHDSPLLLEWLQDSPKTVQRFLRKIRAAIKQTLWAMTSLLQHKDSPWRGLEVKAAAVEHGVIKFLEILRSGIAFGKFSEVHVQDFEKLLENVHKLYMDLFERRGHELLRSAIMAEPAVLHLLPDSSGRLPDGTSVVLQNLKGRTDLNGKAGQITNWDYSLQRYTVELEQEKVKNPNLALPPANPTLLAVADDIDEEEEMDDKPDIPKKLMVMPKNVIVDLEPVKRKLESLAKDWAAWRKRPRSVSASQDAEAVAAALGPPLEKMGTFLQEAASAVSTAAACGQDGADLTAFACRDALAGARNLAAELLGEEPSEPLPPPSLKEPPLPLVPVAEGGEQAQLLKEAAEMAQASLGDLKLQKRRSRSRNRKKKRSRSRSRRRRRRESSSSSSRSYRAHRKPKYM